MDYLIVDPFGQTTSGVTSYSEAARESLQRIGLTVSVITKAEGEDLEAFRQRLPHVIAQMAGPRTLVEAPETLATTRYISSETRLHIRLHGSRHFGSWLQNRMQPRDEAGISAEQREIVRAHHVSAPSFAAIQSHVAHFGPIPVATVHPHPAPAPMPLSLTGQAPDIDCLFLGRWQALKGSAFLQELQHRLPHRRFAVACGTQRPPGLSAQILHLAAATPVQRGIALERSRLIVLPSLFETASMVALEAWSYCRPVVAWNHLGIAEYAGAPYLHGARPWQIDDLARRTEEALDSSLYCDFSSLTRSLDWEFQNATRALIDGQQVRSTRLKPPDDCLDLAQVLDTMPALPHPDTMHLVQRRMRKLFRDPQAYWRDSALRRQLTRRMTWSLTPVVRAAEEAAQPTVMPSQPDPIVQSGLHAEPAPALISRPGVQIGHIGPTGLVKLKTPAKGLEGWRIALLHAKDCPEEVDTLIGRLSAFEDFSPARADRISVISFEMNPDEPSSALINRIDQKNKELLGQIDHMVMLDAPATLARALRCCSPKLRTILVSTLPDTLYGPDDADACIRIAPTETGSTGEPWRREITIASAEKLPVALMRLLRETGPKSPNMLLQIQGPPMFDPALHDFDVARFQGRIRLQVGDMPQAETMHEFIKALCPRIQSLHVAESVYMRYRSLCVAVETGGDASALIEACLHDGVLFDVA